MTEEQQKKAKELLLNVLYAQMGGHIATHTDDGNEILDKIRDFLFKELRLQV